MKSVSHIKIGAILSYVGIIINIITSLLYTPWMINSIGKEDFGLYTLAMSVISLFVFDFGLSSAVTRYLSKYLANGEQEKANLFMGLVYKLYLIVDIVLFFILLSVYFFIPNIYQELTPEEIHKFKIVYAIAAIFSVLSFPFIPVNGVLVAYEKFIQSKLCDIIHKLIIVGAMSVCLLMGMGLYALVTVNAVAGLITVVMKLVCIKSYTCQQTNLKYWNTNDVKEIASFSGWVTIKSISQRCIMNISPSILGILSGSSEIAILGIAITVEGYVYTFSSAISGMFLPTVSRKIANNIDILPLMIKVGRIQLMVVGLIITGFLIFGSSFISLWVGDSFTRSYYCAVLMILPSIIHLPQEIAHQTVYVKNKVKLESIVFVTMAIINIFCAFCLAPTLGAVGIGLSICIAYLFRTIGMDVIYYKQLDLNIISFFHETYLPFILPLFFLLTIGYLENLIFDSNSWIILFIKIVIYTLLYALFLFAFYMKKSEKDLIINPLKRILHRK